MEEIIKYPVGQQSFEQLRNDGYLYVDKTRYIEKIITGNSYYFLGRPRRFGKSLFLSTLKCFFEGKKNLFDGLYAGSMEWNWERYPVLHLDLNTRRYQDEFKLDMLLTDFLEEHENKYGIPAPDRVMDASGRLARLIRLLAKSTGKNVVILVDEYDKPLVNNIHDRERFELYRTQLAELYSNFKSSADYIRLVFLTGVSRFGKLSVFSDLNNISDISFDPAYAGICGISEEEMLSNFQAGIKALAEFNDRSKVETIAELKRKYDGYHFSPVSPDIYNPFSLLNVFDKKIFENYWIASGTPTLLLEQLKRTDADLEKITTSKQVQSNLSGLDISNIDPVSLLYQTGYLTIKQYDKKRNIYMLGLPNDEVTEGFYAFIMPAYSNLHREDARIFIFDFIDEVEEGRIHDFMNRMKSMFADTSYEMKMEEERNVQNAMFLLFKLAGLSVDVEYHTSNGRIDILMRTADYIYIMELKYDTSAGEALQQIEQKEYTLPWNCDDRKVIGIGINFSTRKRTIDNWITKELN